MNKRSIIIILAGIILAMILTAAPAKAQGDDLTVTTVADNLYVITGVEWDVNCTFLVTEEGVLVVDTGNNPDDAKKYLKKIKETTAKPIKYVVLTHYHLDHAGGIGAFPTEAAIVASETCAHNINNLGKQRFEEYRDKVMPQRIETITKELENQKKANSPDLKKTKEQLHAAKKKWENLKSIKVIAPTITFKDKKILTLGKEKIEVIYPGPGHTNGNSVVYIPGKKTVIMGDMFFNNYFPYIDAMAKCDTKNWAVFLGRLQTWNIEKVVPGHGKVSGKEGLKKMAQYLTDLRAAVKEAKAKGLTVEQAQKTIKLEKYSKMGFPFFLPICIDAVYQEMK
ncbi:MAG: MBL fold metallo-hydrolase [bacterium]|nr:MBL fold metallo-hydrolase [bacterium]